MYLNITLHCSAHELSTATYLTSRNDYIRLIFTENRIKANVTFSRFHEERFPSDGFTKFYRWQTHSDIYARWHVLERQLMKLPVSDCHVRSPNGIGRKNNIVLSIIIAAVPWETVVYPVLKATIENLEINRKSECTNRSANETDIKTCSIHGLISRWKLCRKISWWNRS